MKIFSLAVCFVAMAFAGTAFAGGDKDQDMSKSDQYAGICQKAGDFESAVMELRNMPPDATMDDLDKAKKNVKDSYKDLKKEIDKSKGVEAEDVKQAYKALNDRLDKMPKDATMEQAQQSIQMHVNNLATALKKLEQSADC